MSSLQQLSSISKLLASGNFQKSDVYAQHGVLYFNFTNADIELP